MDSAQQKDTALIAIENLRKRLLDLTARNRLINFRHTKGSSLRIIGEPPDHLSEILLSEMEIRFLPVPEPTRKQLIEAGYISIDEETGQENRLMKNPTAEEWARWLGLKTSYEMPLSPNGESKGRKKAAVKTLRFPHELETRLRSLRQKAQSAIEETGANILYLAIGFLEWFENYDSENYRIAPLFLLPAQLKKGRLNRKTGTYEYTLGYSGEDILTNLSLREKLRVDFGLALPELDENTTPEIYLKKVQRLIKENRPKWCVRRFITLTLLNFKKLLMYLDLDHKRWPEDKQIIDHPIVTHFLAGYSRKTETDENEPDLGFGEEYDIDELSDVHKSYPLIDDADSSQHSALIDAVDGKNIVIEGPPGTGKSQTITNLIAACLAQGKRVLFVAEKLAALEIVKHRLDLAGIGDFCLELHSHKTQKHKMLIEVGERLKKRHSYRNPLQINDDIARYEELKQSLKNYAELINRYWKRTGKTLHEIFMLATRNREALNINPETIRPEGYNGNNFDATSQRRIRDQLLAFGDMYHVIVKQLGGKSSLQNHPWFGVRNTDLQMFDIEQVKDALWQWQKSLQFLKKLFPEMVSIFACEESKIPLTHGGLDELLFDLRRLPKLEGDELLDCLPVLCGDELKEFEDYIKLYEAIQDLYGKLAGKFSEEVFNDLSNVDSLLRGSKQLREIVDINVKIESLSEAIDNLYQLLNELEEIQKLVYEINLKIDERAAKYFELSESGLHELKVFINTVKALPPLCWKLRNRLFDNDELDQVLPEISCEIETLNQMKVELEGVYNTIYLPSQSVLRDLRTTIFDGGTFRWFKGSWRTARKRLLGYVANTGVKFKEMTALLDKAITYVEARHAIEQNQTYKELLGNHAKGIDTNIESLEQIRSWYRQVRQTYGLGFGPKVAIGDAIIDMPIDLARFIRSLAERGISGQLSNMLDDLSNLKQIFTPIQEMQNDRTLLVGSNGLLTRILASLRKALRDCVPIKIDSKYTVRDVVQQIQALKTLRGLIRDWKKEDCGKRLLNDKLGLKIGLNQDYHAALSMARHTLRIASHLNQENTSPLIRDRIYNAPDGSTFESLYSLGHKLGILIENQNDKRDAFEKLVKLNIESWLNACGDSIEKLIVRNDKALSNEKALQSWLDYVRVRQQLIEFGFDRLADKAEKGEIHIDQLEEAYYAGIYGHLAREIIRELPELGRFSGHNQESLRQQFKHYDERLKTLQCERIAWQVDQVKVPRGNRFGKVSEYTELCLIEHEIGKKKRHIPIRQLVKRASAALVALKPCFMMGPMSVAQYLEPGQIEFDLIVMDEASQIKPQDALGAIARGSQLIVVGDPKQLPPTSFFERVIDEEDEDPTAIEESESILDAALPMFPARRLRWHYRSQHESLIAFSNQFFYMSDLVLFPSPINKSEEYGVKYFRIKRGTFVNRRNLEEARIISEAVREHYRHRKSESLGVVAMSAEQRDQIERSVEVLAKEDPALQKWLEIDQTTPEPLFIKNLENVQGDERDVIFISMTYGSSEIRGKVYQRFGPINSDVGWRRLNVLFTRSRKRMHVFSSMDCEDIQVGPNSRRGVQALRDFIAYCESGFLSHTEGETGRAPDSDFEIAVAEALQDSGFECKSQVGVAGFFIDIAVIDPGNPGRYLMGIECDGATYHSAKSVRDRDRLRQEILERLGWRIKRIWSTDWFKNPQAELSPIIRELQELKSERPVEGEIIEDELKIVETDEKIEKEIEQEELDDRFISKEIGLKEKLVRFDLEVIRKDLPDTPESQRLLRPAMLEAFLEYLPASKAEFLEYIPYYLRQTIKADEGKYLNNVLEIINSTTYGSV